MSNEQIAVNVMRYYIEDVERRTGSDGRLSKQYILILRVRYWQLRRRLRNKKQTLDDLQILKHGHRTAEHFLLEIDVPGAKPQPILQEIKNILNLIALEFHAEIVAIERRHPEMKAEFTREREAHRIRWNDYLEATQQKV